MSIDYKKRMVVKVRAESIREAMQNARDGKYVVVKSLPHRITVVKNSACMLDSDGNPMERKRFRKNILKPADDVVIESNDAYEEEEGDYNLARYDEDDDDYDEDI